LLIIDTLKSHIVACDIVCEDGIILTITSNANDDLDKSMVQARQNLADGDLPIYFEINPDFGDEKSLFTAFGVEEAKEIIATLTSMVEYLEGE
jgi:hypothetical protein